MVGVGHDNGKTHLYFSDITGEIFTLSFSNVRYFPRKMGEDYVFSVDIVEVFSLIQL